MNSSEEIDERATDVERTFKANEDDGVVLLRLTKKEGKEVLKLIKQIRKRNE